MSLGRLEKGGLTRLVLRRTRFVSEPEHLGTTLSISKLILSKL